MFSKIIKFHFNTHFILLFIASFVASIALHLINATPAQAECTYGGQTYRTGATRGPYVCMPDGTWQRK